ncbi:PREDICTED: zinc finger BED domain-containing protein RICESLEEPER 1-like [Brassica oleracea var. oleracea]|uniref:zinc finger BED domain-containing protein RICESLEEPER 1-like n=1 Tax=Brassica oleracea var. oleracea TaxID=109376 RepID=UPI0006A6F3B7|nr:PREDICTED: zinc finger BED domain-containing protein RICESLEEPER 1-like [Brassica oleracea var. oleracea]
MSIAVQLLESLKEWRIDKKVFSVTLDNATNTAGVVESGWLILDASTRWNSTYYMLERALKYRKAFVKLETFDKKGYKTAPTAEEWTKAANICDFLGPFAVITSLMSGSNYPTANLYFYQVWLIHDWLRRNEESDDEIVRHMVPPMKEKFNKYWDEVSCVFAMVVVFDPRFKLSIVEFCLGKLDMSTRDAKVKNLREKLSILFETYDKKSKNNSPSTEPVWECFAQSLCGRINGTDFFAFRKVRGIVSGKTPLQAYLEEPPLDITNFQSLDILDWWKDNAHQYGDLAAMALICTRNWIKGYESYAHDEDINGDDDGEEEKLPTFKSIVDGEYEDE